MPRAIIKAAILWILLGVLVRPAYADDRARMTEPFEITADRILYEAERELYVAERNVHVYQEGRTLTARWVAFSKKTGVAIAEGDVELIDGADRLTADFMVFDVESLRGTLYHVAIDAGSDGFRLRAKEMIRTGRNTFTLHDGVFTTCRCEPGERLPWQFETGRAEVELGRYGVMRNSTFDVLGVPVLWIPWMAVPIKSERETGLLLPNFSFGGRGGAGFGLPFFWAAHPQLNVTLTPRYFVERGYKQDVELEYVFGEQSGGKLFVAGLRDSTKQARGSFNPDRWATLWEHDHFLPGQVRWQTDLKLSSDNLYSDDFVELRPWRTFRFLDSTTNFARSFGASGSFGAMAGMRYADDLQGSTFDDRDEFLLQRFAEVRADVQPGALRGPLGIEGRFDSELIHFSGLRTTESELSGLLPPGLGFEPRPVRTNGRFYDFGFNGRFDGVAENGEGDGVFQPGEPLAERGTRIVLHPRFARPTPIGGLFEFTPELGWSQTLYQSSAQRFAERGLVTARADLRSRLARDFEFADGSGLQHVIEPRLGWAFVADDLLDRSQSQNPLFVPQGSVEQTRLRTLSLESITRDPSDRIDDWNQLVLGVRQRFFTRKGARSAHRLRADLLTAVDWSFREDRGLGDLFVEGRWYPIGPIGSRIRGTFNPESRAVKEGEAEFGIGLPIENAWIRRVHLSTRYRYLRRLPEFFETVRGDNSSTRAGDTVLNQLDLNARLELTARIRLTYRTIYSLAEKKQGFLRNRAMVEYVSKCRCWGFATEVFQERRADVGAGFQIRFLGLGDKESNLFDSGIGAGMNF